MLNKQEIELAKELIVNEIKECRLIPKQVTNLINETIKLEPKSTPFFRLAIITYEFTKMLGSLEHEIVYAERFPDDIKGRNAHLANAKAELGELFTNMQILAIRYGWNIDEVRLIGATKLAERYKDFEYNKWNKV